MCRKLYLSHDRRTFSCYNLTCLIQEQETLGIVPVFWKDEGKDEGPAVLPMVRPG